MLVFLVAFSSMAFAVSAENIISIQIPFTESKVAKEINLISEGARFFKSQGFTSLEYTLKVNGEDGNRRKFRLMFLGNKSQEVWRISLSGQRLGLPNNTYDGFDTFKHLAGFLIKQAGACFFLEKKQMEDLEKTYKRLSNKEGLISTTAYSNSISVQYKMIPVMEGIASLEITLPQKGYPKRCKIDSKLIIK